MKILAIEASGSAASVALTEDNVLKAEFTLNHKMTHSQTLMPLIDEIKKYLELDMDDIDFVACSAGDKFDVVHIQLKIFFDFVYKRHIIANASFMVKRKFSLSLHLSSISFRNSCTDPGHGKYLHYSLPPNVIFCNDNFQVFLYFLSIPHFPVIISSISSAQFDETYAFSPKNAHHSQYIISSGSPTL